MDAPAPILAIHIVMCLAPNHSLKTIQRLQIKEEICQNR